METTKNISLEPQDTSTRLDITKQLRTGTRVLTFDLHPLYASILQEGATIRQGEVLGLDGDLRRVLVAPFTGKIRLLVTGTGEERRVRVYLSETRERSSLFFQRNS